MVATVRCEEIANEKLNHLTSDEVLKAYINIYFCTLICRLLMASSFFFYFLGLVGTGNINSKWPSIGVWEKAKHNYT